jgi:NAD(P)-dependent dehydrogenase (short-subunit alcohol dehydrogenase family)
MADNQFKHQDPIKQHPHPKFPEQTQEAPGLASRMTPRPDHGEESYVGTNRLPGRKALVTGADSGIGAATAIAFAREGADVVLNYLPQEEEDAVKVVDLIKKAGRKAVACPGDLSDEAFCRELVERAARELGGLDILANIAGKQVSVESIDKITTEQLTQTFTVNVFAMFWLCQAAISHMKPGAAIINTSSIQASEPSPNLLDYAATKAAILNFTKALGKQLAPKGIRENSDVWRANAIQASGAAGGGGAGLRILCVAGVELHHRRNARCNGRESVVTRGGGAENETPPGRFETKLRVLEAGTSGWSR